MSEIFRIEKRNDFTIVRNGLLRDKTMSLKAKGLLITMLSKPDGWDYTLNGLQTILFEGRDAIASGLNELERHGYLVRHKTRDRFATRLWTGIWIEVPSTFVIAIPNSAALSVSRPVALPHLHRRDSRKRPGRLPSFGVSPLPHPAD